MFAINCLLYIINPLTRHFFWGPCSVYPGLKPIPKLVAVIPPSMHHTRPKLEATTKQGTVEIQHIASNCDQPFCIPGKESRGRIRIDGGQSVARVRELGNNATLAKGSYAFLISQITFLGFRSVNCASKKKRRF